MREVAPTGPSVTSQAAFGDHLGESGTRSQWPPVYGDFSSMAAAIIWMKLSSSSRHLAVQQQLVVERDAGLRGERLHHALVVGVGTARTLPVSGSCRVEQLQHADDGRRRC
jgi:hypothetical protein